MALRDWFTKKTPLQLALDRGLADGGDLAEEVRQLGEFEVSSRADAQAICSALEQLINQPSGREAKGQPLLTLLSMFDQVDGPESKAFAVFEENGVPLLLGLVEAALADAEHANAEEFLWMLKVLSAFRTSEGTDAVIQAARLPFHPESHAWTLILGAYGAEHPEVDRLFEAFRDQVPPGAIAGALLEAGNAARLTGGDDLNHPFDSAAGIQRLETYLTDANADHIGFAMSAAYAMAFLNHPERNRLLSLATNHPDTRVRLEAAWAAAQLERDEGVESLARFCLDVHHADRAAAFLRELERDDAIPKAARDPDFQATAQYSAWLQQPTELGVIPDELEIIDRRQLAWPPDGNVKTLRLVRYLVRKKAETGSDNVGVGIVGSGAIGSFTGPVEQRPTDDLYALHCYRELQNAGYIIDKPVEESSDEYDSLLEQWSGDLLDDAALLHVAEFAPDLRYPQARVALASAQKNGEPGWVVLDGRRSHWYPQASALSGVPQVAVLHLHVGRVLLGFEGEPDPANRSNVHP